MNLNDYDVPGGIPPTFDYRPGAPRPTPSFISNTEMKLPGMNSMGFPVTSGTAGFTLSDEDSFDDDDNDWEANKCQPCTPLDEFVENSASPSVTSLLDYNIFEGLVVHQEEYRSPTDAFVPIGGMVAPEQKRKDFMEYLKKSGFLSAISKMLLSLWEEDPWPNTELAIEYLAKCLGYKLTIHDDIAENATFSNILRVRIQRLEVENDWMRRHLDDFETSETKIKIVNPDTFPPIIYQMSQKEKKARKQFAVFHPIFDHMSLSEHTSSTTDEIVLSSDTSKNLLTKKKTEAHILGKPSLNL